MPLNITCQMTEEMILQQVHKLIVSPILFCYYLIISFVVLIFGILIINENKGNHPYKKFLVIWGIASFIGGMIVLFLISSPNVVLQISNFFSSLWS